MKKSKLNKLPKGRRPYNYEILQYSKDHKLNVQKDYLQESKVITTEGHLDCAVRNYNCGLI